LLIASFDTFLGTFHLTLDFSAQARKTTVLLGESGAGKTTVLRLLAGLLDPERGRIALDGVTYFESELPLIAEVTESSTVRMELQEGKLVYATFKATEARAYT